MLLGREHVSDRRMTKPAAAGSALLARYFSSGERHAHRRNLSEQFLAEQKAPTTPDTRIVEALSSSCSVNGPDSDDRGILGLV